MSLLNYFSRVTPQHQDQPDQPSASRHHVAVLPPPQAFEGVSLTEYGHVEETLRLGRAVVKRRQTYKEEEKIGITKYANI